MILKAVKLLEIEQKSNLCKLAKEKETEKDKYAKSGHAKTYLG